MTIRSLQLGKCRDVGQRGQSFSYRMNKFWRPKVQFVDYIQYTAYYILYYVQYIIFNNALYVGNFPRIDLLFSPHTQNKIYVILYILYLIQ